MIPIKKIGIFVMIFFYVYFFAESLTKSKVFTFKYQRTLLWKSSNKWCKEYSIKD